MRSQEVILEMQHTFHYKNTGMQYVIGISGAFMIACLCIIIYTGWDTLNVSVVLSGCGFMLLFLFIPLFFVLHAINYKLVVDIHKMEICEINFLKKSIKKCSLHDVVNIISLPKENEDQSDTYTGQIQRIKTHTLYFKDFRC
ncbi:MAG: hypothetical protein QM758_28795 [Armatimonas sp.]